MKLLTPKLAPEIVTIHNQGSERTDAAFAAITAMETSLAWQGDTDEWNSGKVILLSARYVHEKAKIVERKPKVDAVPSLSTVAYVIHYYCVPFESDWPYELHDRPKGMSWRELDSGNRCYSAITHLVTSYDIHIHLSHGRPIISGVNIYSKSADDYMSWCFSPQRAPKRINTISGS